MKLYRIIVLHGGPKDSHTSTETYLVAKNDEEVFNYIDTKKNYNFWTESESKRYADDNDEETVTFREWVMLNHGDLEDEEGWEDAYYGVTKWGWEEVSGATESDIKCLLELGIAVNNP